MLERTTHARERGARAVHGTPTAEIVPTGAAFQMRRPPDILSVQAVRGIGLPKTVRTRNVLMEGNDRNLGRGRRESLGQARLQRTQSTRVIRI
jgi:hypothetical protein